MREKLFTLSRTQRENMWRRFKQTDERRVAERLHAILLLDSGQNAEAVSSILHIHPKTLKRWIKAFATGGEEALTSFNYIGSEGWMSDEQLQQFTTWLDSDVRSTSEAIAWVEQQFELSYSDSGMRKLLKRLGYRYRQPSVLPAKADVEAQAAWVETYTAKKKGFEAPRQSLLSRCDASTPRRDTEPGLDQAWSLNTTQDELWQESPQYTWGLFALRPRPDQPGRAGVV